MEDDDGCPSVYPISSPQNLAHPFQSHPQQQMFLQQQQEQQQHFPPFQQLEESLHRQIQHQQRQGQPHQHPLFSVNFKLGLNENSCTNTQEGPLNQQGAASLLHGCEPNLPHSLVMPHCWQPQEDPITIKQPFWKLLNRSTSGEQESKEKDQSKYCKPLLAQQVDGIGEKCKNLENKYRLFGELEAIYSHTRTGESNQAGSGSALTRENSPTNAGISVPLSATQTRNFGAIGSVKAAIGVDHGSENSIGGEASLRKSRKRKRKRKMKEKLSSLVGFFHNLVKQVVDHQEMLHRKFLEVIERMDKERAEKEEAWRRQEAENHNREAISRAHEQDLASSREAQIVSYIEKITGQSINLPARKTPFLLQPQLASIKTDNQSRWPKAEVEALIQVRSSIENKFQEPGLKGPLWEEVSSLLGSLGYHRSARRCKDKWENINKYFKKSKESAKRRCQQSKPSPYFDQLDQLYSTTLISSPSDTLSSMPLCSSEGGMGKQGYAELLEAFIVGRNIATSTSNCSPLEESSIAGMGGSSGLQINGSTDENAEPESHQLEKQDADDKDANEGHNRVGGDGNDKEIVGIKVRKA